MEFGHPWIHQYKSLQCLPLPPPSLVAHPLNVMVRQVICLEPEPVTNQVIRPNHQLSLLSLHILRTRRMWRRVHSKQKAMRAAIARVMAVVMVVLEAVKEMEKEEEEEED